MLSGISANNSGDHGSSVAQFEVEIARVHEEAERLPGDEDRIAPMNCINQQEQAAANREKPECKRDHHAVLALARYPLHGETRCEQNLRDKAERNPPVQLRDKDLVQVVADFASQINEHRLEPPLLLERGGGGGA